MPRNKDIKKVLVIGSGPIIIGQAAEFDLAYEGKNIFTVQFHPEACPGPLDSGYLFDRFMKMMGGEK